jgi:hypothetical protein
MDELDDPSVLTGISKIVNPSKVNSKLDLDAIERELMKDGGIKPLKVKSSEQELNDIMRDIRTEPIQRPYQHNSHVARHNVLQQNQQKQERNGGSPLSTLQRFVSQTNPSIPFGNDSMSTDFDQNMGDETEETEKTEIDELENWEEEPEDAPLLAHIGSSAQGLPAPPALPYSVPATPPRQQYSAYPAQPTYLRYPQVPQVPQKTSYAQEALQAYAGDHEQQEALIEQERLEDQKEKMISDIEDLREELNSEQIKTDRIPEVTIDSSYADVAKVYKQIKRKYDRSRCEGLGESVMMASARMIEMVFDGQKSYFGYRPDMTGWNRTVRSKMRRMKYEQSVIVSEALEYWNVGPIQRMGLELIPSAFLYSLTRKEQHGRDNYTPDTAGTANIVQIRDRTTEDDRADALNDLREFDG